MILTELLRQSKIEHLHLAVVVDHYICRLDIAMNYAASVSLHQGCGYLNNNRDCSRKVEFAVLHQLSKRPPSGEFHNKKRPAFFSLAIVKECGNAGVAQLRNGARFAQETGAIVMRVRVQRGKLDSNSPAEMGVFGQVDGSHTALAEGFQDAIM